MSQIASELNLYVRDVIANPSVFFHHYKNILIQSQYPVPLQRRASFITDILDCQLPCLLTDDERRDMLFYICCD